MLLALALFLRGSVAHTGGLVAINKEVKKRKAKLVVD
jgi:hypothetical protein